MQSRERTRHFSQNWHSRLVSPLYSSGITRERGTVVSLLSGRMCSESQPSRSHIAWCCYHVQIIAYSLAWRPGIPPDNGSRDGTTPLSFVQRRTWILPLCISYSGSFVITAHLQVIYQPGPLVLSIQIHPGRVRSVSRCTNILHVRCLCCWYGL